jgi:putative heme iron utilization protein
MVETNGAQIDTEGSDGEDAAMEAGRLLRSRSEGVLSTISKRVTGWPFGSVAPYALNARGEPLLFISTIAEHTKNIDADARASLLVQEIQAGDVQAHGRLTVMGRASRVDAEEIEDARARYLSRVPTAAGHSDAHDFLFYRLSLDHLRFIGGFGRIHWLEPKHLLLDPARDPLAESARSIVEHMNGDHADAIALYCRAFKTFSPTAARMVSIDQFGFDVSCSDPDQRVRFDFDVPATPDNVRSLMVDLVRRARSTLGVSAEKGGDRAH